MMLRFSFDYGAEPPTPEQLAVLRAHVQHPDELVDAEGKPHTWREHTGDVVAILQACPDLKLRVIGGEVGATGLQAILTTMHDLATKVDRLAQQGAGIEGRGWNDRCHVHVPGLGMLMMDHATVLEDACTTDLQHHLDQGWRILAVCPQPHQRRPDYVLGRVGVRS